MKFPLFFGMALALFGAAFGLDHWETDLKTAQEKAARENKGIILVYRGKDWKPGEYGRPETMFTMERFLTPAMKNYILLEQHYPKELKLSEEDQKELTLFFADSKGRPFHKLKKELGNGVQWFCECLERAEQKRSGFGKLADRAIGGTGDDKYKAVGELMEQIDFSFPLYSQLEEETEKADDKDVSGLKKMSEKDQKEFGVFLALCAKHGIKYLAEKSPDNLTDAEKMRAAIILFSSKELANPDIPKKIRGILQYFLFVMTIFPKESETMSPDEYIQMAQVEKGRIADQGTTPELARLLDYSTATFLCMFAQPEQSGNDSDQVTPMINDLLKKDIIQEFDMSRQIMHYLQGVVALRSGQYDEAMVLLEKARDIDPSLPNAKNITDYLENIRKNKPLVLELLEGRKNGDNRKDELKELLGANLSASFCLD